MNSIITDLKLKNTKLRNVLINIFEDSEVAQSYKSIVENKSVMSLNPNKSTIYRELETLCQKGYLRSIATSGGFNIFEKKLHFHPHLICQKCQTVQCWSADSTVIESSIEQILRSQNINFSEIKLDIMIICAKCLMD